MERWLVKLIALLIIFAVVFGATLLPMKVAEKFIRNGKKGLETISYFMCFGGGVFLGMYMLHMAPDVHRIMDVALITPLGLNYPLTDLIIASGFFLMLVFENLILSCSKAKGSKGHIHDNKPATLQDHTIIIDGTHNSLMDNDHDMTGNTTNDELQSPCENGLPLQERKKPHDHEASIPAEHEHEHSHMQATRSLILLFALSLHHIFEGLSVGLKQNVSSVWNMCVAIVSHEIVIAFSLGMQLLKTYRRKRTFILAALICSVMTPLGVVIGIGLTETGIKQTATMLIVNGTLQGLSTGVFIYITFFEILQEELGNGKVNFKRVACTIFGFALLSILALIPEEKATDEFELMQNSTNLCHCADAFEGLFNSSSIAYPLLSDVK